MGFPTLFPSRGPERPLDPRVEALLRSSPRLDVPDGLRTRLLAAHARRERPVVARGLRPRLGWIGGLAAAAVLLVAVPFLGGGEPPRGAATVAARLPVRVVDDPSLGLHGDALPGASLFGDRTEGP
jgi:hypothetical protein